MDASSQPSMIPTEEHSSLPALPWPWVLLSCHAYLSFHGTQICLSYQKEDYPLYAQPSCPSTDTGTDSWTEAIYVSPNLYFFPDQSNFSSELFSLDSLDAVFKNKISPSVYFFLKKKKRYFVWEVKCVGISSRYCKLWNGDVPRAIGVSYGLLLVRSACFLPSLSANSYGQTPCLASPPCLSCRAFSMPGLWQFTLLKWIDLPFTLPSTFSGAPECLWHKFLSFSRLPYTSQSVWKVGMFHSSVHLIPAPPGFFLSS